MFIMEHFQEGGWGMYPILILFGLTTGIIGLAAFAYLNGKTQNALDDIAEVKKNVSNLLFQAKAAMHG